MISGSLRFILSTTHPFSLECLDLLGRQAIHRPFVPLCFHPHLLHRILDDLPSGNLRHLGYSHLSFLDGIDTRHMGTEETTSPAKSAVPERREDGTGRRGVEEWRRIFRRGWLRWFLSCGKRYERRRIE
jgi:hypothetical protein